MFVNVTLPARRERVDLSLRSADLQKEIKPIDTPRRALNARFAELMSQIRTADYPPDLARQKDQLIACSNINAVAPAAGCLARIQLPGWPAARPAANDRR